MKRIFTLLILALIGSGSLFAQQIQFIDNIGDPFIDSVNIYFVWTATAGGGGGSGEVVDSVIGATFRTASPFNSVKGDGWIYTVYMVPYSPGATSADTNAIGSQALGTFGPVNNGSNYAVIASGLAASDTADFAPNPSGLSTAIRLSVDSSALIHSSNSSRTDFAFFNGISDALPLLLNFNPQTNSSAFPPANLFTPAAYGSFSATNYVDLAGGNYFFSLFDTYSNNYGYFFTQLKGAADSAGILFTSGFVDSIDIANGGAPFGLYVATSGGEVFPFQGVYPAFAQIIYDSPDTSAHAAEVFLVDATMGTLLNEQTLTFGTTPATPYLPVIAGDSVVIAFGPAGDTSFADAFATFGISPLAPVSYNVYIADGVLPSDSAGYPANPEGNSTAFSLYWHAGEVTDLVPHTAALLFFQGIPDDSTMDVIEAAPTPGVTLVSAIQYGNFYGYQNLDSANYVVELTDSAGTTIIQAYVAPFSVPELIGTGAVAYTGGFADTSVGVPFALFGTFPTGTTLPLTTYVNGINSVQALNNIQLYPNPSENNVTLSFSLANDTHVKYSLLNTLGQQMQYMDLGNLSAGTNTMDISVTSLSSGIYLLDLTLDNNTHITRSIVVNR